MSYSGDAAEQVVRMTLEGTEVAAKITGAGAKQIAFLLYAVLRDQKKTKGKIRLTNMLRSGKELKVFAVKDEDMRRFCTEAKKYGVLYCVLKDKDATDGITDVMVRAEDAGKINRIFERFQLTTVDMGSVKSEIERSRAEKAAKGPAAEGKSKEDVFIDELLAPVPAKEAEKEGNPIMGTKSPLSGPSSATNKNAEADRGDSIDHARPSVRQELKEIKEEMRKEDSKPQRAQSPVIQGRPKSKKKKKEKHHEYRR